MLHGQLLERIAKASPLVVVFDEFQDILSLSNHSETLAALRSKIQFHSEIPYVFAGSVRNQMSGIFTDPESAFFKSATVMEVGPLKTDVFARFLSKKFASGKRKIGVDVQITPATCSPRASLRCSCETSGTS